MSDGEVHDVDVVADSRSVGRRIVVAEDVELRTTANCDLRDIRQEVVRDSCGIFADEPRLVRADRVEVAEKNHVPLGICLLDVLEHLLHHELRPAVGVCAAGRREVFADRHRLGIAVDRSGAGEHDVLAAVVAEALQERESAAEVVVVVLERDLRRLADGLERREVDRRPERALLVEHRVHLLLVAYVELVELYVLSGYLLYARKRLLRAVAEIVHHDNLVASVQQLHNRVASDVSGSAGDENLHFT